MMNTGKIRAAFFSAEPFQIDYVYGHGRRAALEKECEILPEIVTPENFGHHADFLSSTEAVFSTWGMWSMSESQLGAMPRLREFYYAAGATDAFARPLLRRGIAVHSA